MCWSESDHRHVLNYCQRSHFSHFSHTLRTWLKSLHMRKHVQRRTAFIHRFENANSDSLHFRSLIGSTVGALRHPHCVSAFILQILHVTVNELRASMNANGTPAIQARARGCIMFAAAQAHADVCTKYSVCIVHICSSLCSACSHPRQHATQTSNI